MLERGYSSDDTDSSEGNRGIEYAHEADDMEDAEYALNQDDEGTVATDRLEFVETDNLFSDLSD